MITKETLDYLADFVDELDTTMDMVEGTNNAYFFNKLGEETGEAHEVFSALLGSESKNRKLTKKAGSVEAALIEELSDTFNVLMIIARRHGFTVDNVFEVGRQKMKIKNDKRRRAGVGS